MKFLLDANAVIGLLGGNAGLLAEVRRQAPRALWGCSVKVRPSRPLRLGMDECAAILAGLGRAYRDGSCVVRDWGTAICGEAMRCR